LEDGPRGGATDFHGRRSGKRETLIHTDRVGSKPLEIDDGRDDVLLPFGKEARQTFASRGFSVLDRLACTRYRWRNLSGRRLMRRNRAAQAAPNSTVIRWVADGAEAAMLRGLASQQCIDAFNLRTRRAAAAWLGGEVIACAWMATESFDESELGLRFELQPSEVWLFAAVVESSRRDQGVYGQLLEFLSDELRLQAVRRILLGVTVGNEPSRRAHARQGARQVGSTFAVRSLGITLCWRHGDVRRLSPLSFTWRRPIRLAVISPAEVTRATVPA
jgi:hypothetical protein